MSIARNIRIGIFTAIGIAIIVGFSFYVNDRPYWNKPCRRVSIQVDDATGLRRKSPVKTLGLEIGYIHAVNLSGDKVVIDVCITAPVKLNAETKAYIKSLGFLGDRFLELKPMDMVKDDDEKPAKDEEKKEKKTSDNSSSSQSDEIKNNASGLSKGARPIEVIKETIDELQKKNIDEETTNIYMKLIIGLYNKLIPTVHAEETVHEGKTLTASRDAEIQDTLKKVGKLVDQLTLMIGDIRELTQQKEFKETVINLNQAMKNLESLLRPNGKTVSNINAALESLKNSTAQAEEIMRRVNRGEGTIGKLINDPSIFDELKAAINSINLLLGKAGTLRTFVDLSAQNIDAYDGIKAKFNLVIQPNPGRYYLLGIASDPRGREKKTRTTTVANNGTPTVVDQTVNEEKGLRITAMFGKYFGPLDLRVGLIEDNGAIGVGYWLDPSRHYGIHAEFFSPEKNAAFTTRAYARAQIYSGIYITAGIDQSHRYNGRVASFYGMGLFFDDDDLKYLLAFK